jgi:Fe-S-cluster containining protein
MPVLLKSIILSISKGKLKYIYAGIRRRLIFYFAKRYFQRQIARRRGACSKAGHCCQATMPWCVYFKENTCIVYKQQPLFCRIFPVDERDQELSDVKTVCGYYFE